MGTKDLREDRYEFSGFDMEVEDDEEDEDEDE